MRSIIFALLLCLPTTSYAQDNIVVDCKVWPEPHSISHNVVFVVDASSSINLSPNSLAKFNLAWQTVVRQIGMDELYFKVIVFHGSATSGIEKETKWYLGEPDELEAAAKWIKRNTGTYSWGLKALRMGIRSSSPLDKNPVTKRGLTVILISDGGLTEGADPGRVYDINSLFDSSIKTHPYFRTGSYSSCNTMIRKAQEWREKQGLFQASIMTIGIENILADLRYGTGVKRPNTECQEWLKKIGTTYGGGYFYVHRRRIR